MIWMFIIYSLFRFNNDSQWRDNISIASAKYLFLVLFTLCSPNSLLIGDFSSTISHPSQSTGSIFNNTSSNTRCHWLKPCLNNGTCIDNIPASDGYYCSCPPGFNGTNCESNNRVCKPNTCYNNGMSEHSLFLHWIWRLPFSLKASAIEDRLVHVQLAGLVPAVKQWSTIVPMLHVKIERFVDHYSSVIAVNVLVIAILVDIVKSLQRRLSSTKWFQSLSPILPLFLSFVRRSLLWWWTFWNIALVLIQWKTNDDECNKRQAVKNKNL